MKPIIVTLASVILLAGCSASYQTAQQGISGNTPATKSSEASTATASLASARGYQPTKEDISRYNNSVDEFLRANVANYSKYKNAMIVVDDKKVSSLKDVKLSDVKIISVLDSSNTSILNSSSADGAIVIRTK